METTDTPKTVKPKYSTRIDIRYAELHDVVFFANAAVGNAGNKLGFGTKTQSKLKLQYDTKLQCLIVSCFKEVKLIPFPTIKNMDVANPELFEIE